MQEDRWRYGEAGLAALAALAVDAAEKAGMSLDMCPLVTGIFRNGGHDVVAVCGSHIGRVRWIMYRAGRDLCVHNAKFIPVREATEQELSYARLADECLRAFQERGWRIIYL